MSRARFVAAGLAAAVVLAGCSSGGKAAQGVSSTVVPSPTRRPGPIAGGPGGITGAEGPYPVTQLLAADTLQVDRGANGGLTTVRLLGIVTPDGSAPVAQCFAREAADEAHRLVDGQQVRIAADPGTDHVVDGQGHPLVYVWLSSGRMLNELLVEGGFAREATGAPPYLYQDDLATYEQRARTAARGLWSTGTCAGNITRRPPVVP